MMQAEEMGRGEGFHFEKERERERLCVLMGLTTYSFKTDKKMHINTLLKKRLHGSHATDRA